jgi:hypothetical protein
MGFMDVTQVRACMGCELGVITASRDKTVKLWQEGKQAHEYSCVTTYVRGLRWEIGAGVIL